ncbi:MAG: type IX secretion system membrane protein PorP/SprF [Bacteroidota bacterium]
MLIGYSYDLSFSGLNAFNNGTHEIMLSYNLNFFK